MSLLTTTGPHFGQRRETDFDFLAFKAATAAQLTAALVNNSTFECLEAGRAAIRADAETAMCDECAKLDKKIDHYRTLMARVTDQLTNEGLEKLIEQLKAEKAALHPQQEA